MLRLWQKLSGRIPPQGRWQHMADPYDGDEIVVLDCETSVFDKRKGELLSVAAVRVKGKEIMLSSAIDITVKSDAVTDPNAVRVHYLRREDREQGVAVSEAIEKLLDFIGNRPICGFYIEYDRAILNRYIKRLYNFQLPNKFIEVSEIYVRRKRRLVPELHLDLTFEGLAKDLNVPVIERHSAMGDVISTALMYIKLTEF
ncbi:MAG: DNA polymerase III subunit epsilon [Oceanospirillaceae bacterium]|uniref:3'-5' exonuclease n=1 Tax=unclassified Thalassolituus TaxID=2624967 RepID=UPI000C5D998F|nr:MULTISPECIES: 3'-5' exonuclease [unclassified Thalassolituus]MAS24093.1 DNA polymerase III subunit epsilon [Oceanospirillaceae bacterium]MAX99591.1 DNA polymerase III subunit epsilon [Oceanospirillaceae bacterium]MBL35162.1 DNA polymerase III subunit epsilon [Oceanospirillaceae bacterium]MBS51348.1 DNA polymerase III subunit epsilon [Oceanospirillaceae bacterium]|tara:strand:+ start:2522 stop:3121 length:600 start_codon:yes stop_codon:yes gene_type:complete